MRRLCGVRSIFLALLLMAAPAFGMWPEGMSFVALEQGVWGLYVVPPEERAPRRIATDSEPRTPAYSAASGRIAYVAADGSVREISLADGNSRTILQADRQRAFTQPAYDGANSMYVVELKEGASVDTDIFRLKSSGLLDPVVTQRSAQFEPYLFGSELYYANVLCTVGCGKIIQEIWRKDLVSGEAEQLTLTNAIARQPVLSPDGKWLYYSSNFSGNFHIWRQSLEGGRAERLTSGRVTDLSPALDAVGNLFFIRHSPAGTRLMRLSAGENLLEMPMPPDVQDIRDLEIDR